MTCHYFDCPQTASLLFIYSFIFLFMRLCQHTILLLGASINLLSAQSCVVTGFVGANSSYCRPKAEYTPDRLRKYTHRWMYLNSRLGVTSQATV